DDRRDLGREADRPQQIDGGPPDHLDRDLNVLHSPSYVIPSEAGNLDRRARRQPTRSRFPVAALLGMTARGYLILYSRVRFSPKIRRSASAPSFSRSIARRHHSALCGYSGMFEPQTTRSGPTRRTASATSVGTHSAGPGGALKKRRTVVPRHRLG